MVGKIVVAFDLYGTLLSTESIAKKLAEHFGQNKAEVIAATWRKHQLEYTWRLNSMGSFQSFSDITHNSLQHALSENHATLDRPATEELMKAYDSLSTFPDVSPAMERLAKNDNVACFVFSNGTNSMVSNSVKKSPDLQPHASAFLDLITVEEVRVFKPAPEVYRYLARKVEMVGREDQIWLVSGNPFDVVGARSIGMQACWVDRGGIGWQDRLVPGLEPTAIAKDLHEIVDIVEKHTKKA
ncbi:MAG: hypothetical protein Q9160_001198 [Pyrenula sp. 1 TL-2023]